MLNTWALLPFDETQFDPDCSHCRMPGYAHRHWVIKGGPAEQPERRAGAVRRALSRLRGGGNARP